MKHLCCRRFPLKETEESEFSNYELHGAMPVETLLYSDPPLLRGNVEDIVAANEGVAVLVLQLPIHVLLRLLQADVHVAIQTGQHTWNLVSGLGKLSNVMSVFGNSLNAPR